ncbi:MAG: hypothetical protein ACR2QM_07005 [Longimicrobiales bacterium]
MNWDAIGAVGDAVGGIGVLVTLLYLAAQTRHNTRAVRAATYSQVSDGFSSLSLALFQDPIAADLVRRARDEPESLSDDEENRYGVYLLSYMRRAENMFFQSEEGTLDADTWLGIRDSIFLLVGTEPARRWWSSRGRLFNPSFRQFVESGLSVSDTADGVPSGQH